MRKILIALAIVCSSLVVSGCAKCNKCAPAPMPVAAPCEDCGGCSDCNYIEVPGLN